MSQIQMTVLVEGVNQIYQQGSPYPKPLFDTKNIRGPVKSGFLIPEVQGVNGNMWSFSESAVPGASDQIPALEFQFQNGTEGTDLETYIVSGSIADYNVKVNTAPSGSAIILTPIAPYNT